MLKRVTLARSPLRPIPAATEPDNHFKWTEYVDGFKKRLFEAVNLVKVNLKQAQSKMKCLYDRRTERSSLCVGDQVLPVISSLLKAKNYEAAVEPKVCVMCP